MRVTTEPAPMSANSPLRTDITSTVIKIVKQTEGAIYYVPLDPARFFDYIFIAD